MQHLWKRLAETELRILSCHRNKRLPGSSQSFRAASWSLNCYDFSGELTTPAGRFPIQRNTIVLFPPGQERRFHYQSSGRHDVVHFEAPLEAPKQSVISQWSSRESLQMIDLAKAIVFRSWPEDPARATHFFRSIFYTMARELEDRPAGNLVEQALHIILDRADRPIRVPELARELGVSHNHLGRQFKRERGETLIHAIRRIRMERAHDLLLHTDLPIKVIASEVGIADLQRFNKTVHNFWNASPRSIRALGH